MNPKKVTKAVFTVAGLVTYFLPATKSSSNLSCAKRSCCWLRKGPEL